MGQITDSKRLGIGSVSLILSIFGAMFSFTAWNGKELGEHVLSAIGISLPIGIISLFILFISFFIGYKYKNDYLSKLGRVISVAFILLIVILSIMRQLNSFRTENPHLDSMNKLPKGKYLSESTSPNGTYTIRTYLCDGGATVDYAVRGELIINATNKRERNIYWDYKINVSEITWDSDDYVTINGHKINLPKGSYDWRVDS